MSQIPIGPQYGNGHDGPKTVSGSEILDVYKSQSGNATDDHVDVASGDEASFSPGDLVMLVKSRGNDTTNTGPWEFLTVLSTADSLVTFTTNLVNSYQDAGNNQSQIVLVPQYTVFDCPFGQTLSNTPWDGNIGGIAVIVAKTSITIGGSVDVSEDGYRAGAAAAQGSTDTGKQGGSHPNETFTKANAANGGGGGGGTGSGSAQAASGGGGGAYVDNGIIGQVRASPAGAGGNSYGIADLSKIFFGSAGGGGGEQVDVGIPGTGGKGAGIVILIAPTIIITGSIVSNGQVGELSTQVNNHRDGCGGGGAGGSVLLKGDNIDIGTNLITCSKGLGGDNIEEGGDGGDASVGRLRIEYGSSLTGSTNDPVASTEQKGELIQKRGGAIIFSQLM